MKKLSISLIPVFFCILIPYPAHAYIDPGTGSLIIQSIVAATAGVLFYLKIYWHKVKRFFSKKDKLDDQKVTSPEIDEK